MDRKKQIPEFHVKYMACWILFVDVNVLQYLSPLTIGNTLQKKIFILSNNISNISKYNPKFIPFKYGQILKMAKSEVLFLCKKNEKPNQHETWQTYFTFNNACIYSRPPPTSHTTCAYPN